MSKSDVTYLGSRFDRKMFGVVELVRVVVSDGLGLVNIGIAWYLKDAKEVLKAQKKKLKTDPFPLFKASKMDTS